ncbi:MAG: hypothetical protein WAR76_12625, partial [Xanthobacteraceae bacterium]
LLHFRMIRVASAPDHRDHRFYQKETFVTAADQTGEKDKVQKKRAQLCQNRLSPKRSTFQRGVSGRLLFLSRQAP